MKKIYFVRHGESTSNAGQRTNSPADTPLTVRGKWQADHFALVTPIHPKLIVHSKFDRAKQTAEPFIRRFGGVPVAQWDVHEFIQLEPSNWNGTTHEERQPKIREHWEKADPQLRDGPGSESFADMMRRADHALLSAELTPHDTVVVFTHGFFMKAVLWTLTVRPENCELTPDTMRRVRSFESTVSIPNLTVMPVYQQNHGWSVGRMFRGVPF